MAKGFLVGLVLALLACATLKNDQTVCAEYRDLRCAAGPVCNMNQARGCKVCQCENVMGRVGPDGNSTVNTPAVDQR